MSERVFCVYCRNELTSEDELRDQAHNSCKNIMEEKKNIYLGTLNINKEFIILIDCGNHFKIVDNFDDLNTQSGLTSRTFLKLFKKITQVTGSKLDKKPLNGKKRIKIPIYSSHYNLIDRMINDFEMTDIYENEEELQFKKEIYIYLPDNFDPDGYFYEALERQFLKNHEYCGFLFSRLGYIFIPKDLEHNKYDFTYYFNLNQIKNTISKKLQLDNLELFISDDNIGKLVIKSQDETLYFYFTVNPNLSKVVAGR